MDEMPLLRIVLTALPLLAFIVNLSFGVFIFRRKRLLVNRIFAILMFAFCWWNMGEFAMRIASTKGAAVLILKFINVATPFIPSIALAFVLALENRIPTRRQFTIMVVGPLFFVILDIIGLLADNVSVRFGVFMIAPMGFHLSSGYVYFTLYMSIFTAYVVKGLVEVYRTCENELVKKRIRYMLAGVFITLFVTFITEFLVPLGLFPIDIPSLGSFSTIFLTSLTYYSVRSR